MLKYSIKLSDDNINQEEIVWGEKYLSPDLSFVSGVTSQDYHLEKFNNISVSNTISHTSNSVLPIETKNVIRQGFIVIRGKEYPIESGVTYDGSINYLCVNINGKYYYNNDNTLLIDEWLQVYDNGNVKEAPYSVPFYWYDIITSSKYISCSASIMETSVTDNKSLEIDTVVWIEDGTVTIDGETYIYDFNLNALRKEGSNEPIDASAITHCQDIEYSAWTDSSDYKYVTKFVLTKNEQINEPFEKISFVKYYYYILYKNNYFTIYKNENNVFMCQIPKELLGVDGDGLNEYSAYTDVYIDADFEVEIPIIVSGDSFDILRENLCYININGDKFEIQNDILNANDGSLIGIYLEDEAYNVGVGDIVYFVDTRGYTTSYNLYDDGSKQFIVYKGERYDVIPNLCDKILMQDYEYDIEYVNGRVIGNECIVHIGKSNLSMTISGETEPTYLTQKGLVVSRTPSSAVTMTYEIKPYSGVTINGINYEVKTDNYQSTINIDIPNEYRFIVSDVKGSSMLICKPYLNRSDFSEEFINNFSMELCNELIPNQTKFVLYFKNKIFGDREITKELAINNFSGATSSDDYFDLFENLTLYTPNGYINLPLSLSSPQGNNPIQDNIVDKDFYEAEKKKAINPIIDMERDVYAPKYFDEKYSGSNTTFKEINEIRFNLHFRTRNLESWKVNEEYNNIGDSGLCNWFITDYYPYKDSSYKGIDDCSDIIGLLGFTNNDVYYQKSKIGKSFLRLSFYDSIDQQTQMLLDSSTIFMDEHKLFKKYIDNSRKGMFNKAFRQVGPDMNRITANKISVNTEYTGMTVNDEHRLGSEFIINNKFETDTSAEGYYLYIFREYSEKLVPKPIYMKIEFNHAGFGRTIPFIIPMKWTDADRYGNKYPDRTLDIKQTSDLNELKKGIKLEDSYAQSYIPLYAVYDFKHREYAYVFDRRYANVDEEGNLILNLFEIKFANDTETSEQTQKKITQGIQPTAKIDINKSMFDDTEKTCGDDKPDCGCNDLSLGKKSLIFESSATTADTVAIASKDCISDISITCDSASFTTSFVSNTITVRPVGENTGTTDITGAVTVNYKANGEACTAKTISLKQKGSCECSDFDITSSPSAFTSGQTTAQNVSYSAESCVTSVTASSSDSWLTVSVNTSSKQIVLTPTPNSGPARTSTVTVTPSVGGTGCGSDYAKTFVVTQEGSCTCDGAITLSSHEVLWDYSATTASDVTITSGLCVSANSITISGGSHFSATVGSGKVTITPNGQNTSVDDIIETIGISFKLAEGGTSCTNQETITLIHKGKPCGCEDLIFD